MYQEEDIRKILIDLKNKVEACVEVGLGDLAHSFNEALNCLEALSELSTYDDEELTGVYDSKR